jgi:predicted aspartyl protease
MSPRRIRLTKDEDGYVRVEVSVSSILDPKKKLKLSFIADTGASISSVPKEVAERLNIESIGEVNVILADGSVKPAKMGTFLIEVQGRRMSAHMIYGSGFDALMGMDVMAGLGIHVDTVSKTALIPIRHFKLLTCILKLKRG